MAGATAESNRAVPMGSLVMLSREAIQRATAEEGIKAAQPLLLHLQRIQTAVHPGPRQVVRPRVLPAAHPALPVHLRAATTAAAEETAVRLNRETERKSLQRRIQKMWAGFRDCLSTKLRLVERQPLQAGRT